MFVAVNITIHTSADYVHVISLFTHLKRCVATHFGKVLDANGNFRKCCIEMKKKILIELHSLILQKLLLNCL